MMESENFEKIDNVLELKTISEVLDYNFFIPCYQRGYKWTKQQVVDLLNDIDSFKDKEFFVINKETGEKEKVSTWYCLQPLVVKKLSENEIKQYNLVSENEKCWYEVIDGQQRLTTIYLIVTFINIYKKSSVGAFNKNPKNVLVKLPKMTYATRNSGKNNAAEFLKGFYIENGDVYNSYNSNMDECIDFHYMKEAFIEIINWWQNKDSNFVLDDFKRKLLNYTKFIWYESKNENPIKVFQRLNVGKIPLTSAELIKALFLNQSNYGGDEATSKHIYLQQIQIASEWDKIEYKLQDENFWLFLNDLNYKKPTRIDFIFDLMKNQDLLEVRKNFFDNFNKENIQDLNDKEKIEFIEKKYNELIGDDDYSTFRYFYEYFKSINGSEIKTLECWKKIKNLYMVFEEWYEDIEMYHYIGYLLYFSSNNQRRINDLYTKWLSFSYKEKGLILFKNYLKDEIKNLLKRDKCTDLEQVYELDGKPKKTKVKSLLLLHNIETVIIQNRNYKEKKDYQNGLIYKFPFSLFKKESWNIEHISPAHPNELDEESAQREYLMSVYNSNLLQDYKNKIKKYLSTNYEDTPEERTQDFQKLIADLQQSKDSDIEILSSDIDRNKIWNFVLLDEHTNKSYGNSIFSAKRRVLIGKDQGKQFAYDTDTFELKEIEIAESEKDKYTSFVPVCTKNAFMKFYSPMPNDLTEWTKDDAICYKKDIENTLKVFLE